MRLWSFVSSHEGEAELMVQVVLAGLCGFLDGNDGSVGGAHCD